MRQQSGVGKLTVRIISLLFFLASAAQAAAVYNFINFEGPGSGTLPATGTNMNGIANAGAAVGFGINNIGNFTNFVRNPNGTFTLLNINGLINAMALGINSAGDVVGTENGSAFLLPFGGSVEPLIIPAPPSIAFTRSAPCWSLSSPF